MNRVVPIIALAALALPRRWRPKRRQARRVRPPDVHGAGIVTKVGHGFTTNSGDQTVTMFDLKTLAVLKQIKVGPGLDGIMYDEPDDKVILTNHSRPTGCDKTSVVVDASTGKVVASIPNGTRVDALGRDPSKRLISLTAPRSRAIHPRIYCSGDVAAWARSVPRSGRPRRGVASSDAAFSGQLRRRRMDSLSPRLVRKPFTERRWRNLSEDLR